MGAMRRLAIAAGLMLALLSVPGAAHGAPPLAGPPGASASKVLVIGTDGTRIDLVQRLVAAGRAPRLASLGTEGFAVPSLLAYQPPEAATLSEVGWSSIATGVWPAKHGVRGIFVNNDPGQATKNGYPDFLTRVEQVRPGLSTFLASNWANIGRHENGGPIFGDRIDARYALAAPGTIEGWDQADQEVTDVAARYLPRGRPRRRVRVPRGGRRGGAPGRVANAALPAGDRGHRPPHRAAARPRYARVPPTSRSGGR